MTSDAEGGAPPPKTAEDFERRAWLQYIRKDLAQAEADFQKALELKPSLVDAAYGLGITLKAAGENERARGAFEKVSRLLDEGHVKDEARAKILQALTRAQVAFLTRLAAEPA